MNGKEKGETEGISQEGGESWAQNNILLIIVKEEYFVS